MSQALHFVVVNGYGCHLVPELRGYLDQVIRFINEQKPSYLVLCGGATQKKSAPNTTEAALMAIYIRERLTHVPAFIIEDDSYTTFENVQNACRVIRDTRSRIGHWFEVKVDVFCEAQRALKTLQLYWFLLPELRQYGGKRVRVQTVSWELANPFKELVHIGFDLVSLVIPGFARFARRKRIRRSQFI